MKCKKFDNWIKSIPVNPRGYTKKSDDFPYLSVFVYANGKKRVFLSRSQGQKICDIGYFEAENGGFETLWDVFKFSDDYRMNRAEIKELILNYGHPIKEEYEALEKKEIASVKKAIPPQEDSNKKMTYSQIDSWIADLPLDKRYYKKIVPDFPYVQVNVKSASRVKEFWLINPKTKKKIAYLGVFGKDKSEQLFSHIFAFFDEMKNSNDQYKKSYQWIIDIYSMPRVDKPKTEEERENLEEKIAELKQKIELEEQKAQEEAKLKEEAALAKKEAKLRALRDDTTIEYEDFVDAKEKYTKRKAERTTTIRKGVAFLLYIAAAVFLVPFIFGSCLHLFGQLFSDGSAFLMTASFVLILIVAMIGSYKFVDNFIEEEHEKLLSKAYSTFFLKDEENYNGVLNIMVDDAIDDLIIYDYKAPLEELISRHSTYIPSEVYELRNKSGLSTRDFVNLLTKETASKLVSGYLSDQRAIASKKAVELLNKIKDDENGINGERIQIKTNLNSLVNEIINKGNLEGNNNE